MFQRQLTFGEAVRRAYTVNYCNFNGRASLSEFWWIILLNVIINTILKCFSFLPKEVFLVICGIIFLVTILPTFGVYVRRLHDVGRSGWWLLLILTIIGIIPLIIWWCMPSKPQTNEYGPVPNLEEKA